MSGLLARWAPHAFLGALCAGLAAANVGRASMFSLLLAGLVVIAGSALGRAAALHVLVCGALLLTGWWWASARLDAIDHSVLAPEIGRGGSVRPRDHRPGAALRVLAPHSGASAPFWGA